MLLATIMHIYGCTQSNENQDTGDKRSKTQKESADKFFDMGEDIEFHKDKGIPLTPRPKPKNHNQ